MSNDQHATDRRPHIKSSGLDERTVTFTGPIPLGPNPYGATSYYVFSDVVICDWLSTNGLWQRGSLPIETSGGRTFPYQSIKHVHLIAWPCAVTYYSTEDGGWAVDSWRADIVSDENRGDSITVVLEVAVRGEGARLNRVGYTWTAYVAEPTIRNGAK